MKALVLTEYNRLEYKEIPLPTPQAHEVLIAVKACGICGSDVHGMDGSSGRRIPPIVMGHEAAGVIEQVGTQVSGFQAGDRVTFDSTVYCGRCHFCRQGRINLCDDRQVLGVSCREYRRQGALAEYLVVPQHILYRLPETLSFEQAALVEPLSVAVHAVSRAPIRLNDTAVVVGAGMIGLLVIQVLRASGCGRIVAVDIDRRRLELAGSLGADITLDGQTDDVARQVLERTNGRGADLAWEAVGNPAAIQTAIACLGKGGSLTLVGNITPEAVLPLQAVVTRELSLFGSCASRGEYPACLDLMARGAIRLDPLISATAPLAEGAAWFRRLADNREGLLLKVILTP
ncbi:MAG: galactitol-1-phosphate 5-dehydrogenase [Sedimentisphaerales bacterium]|nr:galactitol-1-phosphate 5-dehydrogenase [Sedimentisphaerales bacterium]